MPGIQYKVLLGAMLLLAGTAMGEADISAWLEPLVHRHSSCYNTPYPTNTFACIDHDPKQMEESEELRSTWLLP